MATEPEPPAVTLTGCCLKAPDGTLVPLPDGPMTAQAFADLLVAERIALLAPPGHREDGADGNQG